MKLKPECRYCGTRVEFFGDVCDGCDTGNAIDDGVAALAAADIARLRERMDET